MKNNSLYLPGFHLQTLRRKPRSAAQILASEKEKIRRHSISSLGEVFGNFIPKSELVNQEDGSFSRRRVFSRENTFWAFFSQILDADGGCREVVRKIQALASERSLREPSSSSSAYCQARKKLSQSSLQSILTYTSTLLNATNNKPNWNGRRVVVVDGTGISMPDTESNQAQWPQSKNQKPGCGFPSARICACFCLHTGALLSHRLGSRKIHELPLLRQQWDTFKPGDIFLGDKGFCSYYDVWKFQTLKVDSVITLARRIPKTEATSVKVLGEGDLLIHWTKPVYSKLLSYDYETWLEMPDKLTLRQIEVTVDNPGFRVQSYYIVTTLTDAEKYPAKQLADLYRQRWEVELFFRDIKTTMGMDILRCHSPDMVIKEVLMFFIVYNSIRMLMLKASIVTNNPVSKISFKSAIQATRQWEFKLNYTYNNRTKFKETIDELIGAIGMSIKSIRPDRSEPRCVKRRPKPFAIMTKPRAEMSYSKTAAKRA